MPGAERKEREGTETAPRPARAPPEKEGRRQGREPQQKLRQADDPGPHAEEGEEGEHQIALEGVHAAAPGREIDGPGVQGAVRPEVQQRPGFIGGKRLILVETRGRRAEAIEARKKPRQQKQREKHKLRPGQARILLAAVCVHGVPRFPFFSMIAALPPPVK